MITALQLLGVAAEFLAGLGVLLGLIGIVGGVIASAVLAMMDL